MERSLQIAKQRENRQSNRCNASKIESKNHKNITSKYVDDDKNENMRISYHMMSNVPLNLMPPPPHAKNNNNNTNLNNFNRRGGWKSGNDIRCNSPQGSESDDSCRSYKGRKSPNNINRPHIARNENSPLSENTLICSKFSSSSPSVFYPNGIGIGQVNNAHFKSKYYLNHQRRDNNKKMHKPFITDINRRVFGLMERFTSRASLFRIPSNPVLLLNGNDWDVLSQSIWDVYRLKAQSETTYRRKLELWKAIYLNIQNVLDKYGLFLVGSTMCGLGLDSSDVDMCLLVRPFFNDARSDAVSYLQTICKMLEDCDFVTCPEVIMAKVPILKFRDATFGFEVDLNCNNSVGIRNTHLLNCYARMDWRVRPLVAIVKLWAQSNDINDAKRMTISSYSLALMVIHFLQCGITPPAIPCLQGMYPRQFSPQIEIHDIDIQEEIAPFYSDNRQSLGELFVGFLQYYTYFDYNQSAISVREASLLPKEECRFVRAPKNDPTQWKYLCIEEPFDLTNTARSVYDLEIFEHIKNVFHISYELLVKTKNLSSILHDGGNNQR